MVVPECPGPLGLPRVYPLPVGGDVGVLPGLPPGDEGIEYVFRDSGERLDPFAVEPEDVIRALVFLAEQLVARILETSG
jgi:hypothetical protein